ncbi:MAG TPA: hypothetical protein PLJ35_22315 [Anaerolineae bacterium]|nr:hypothetical protein [Anaerolineae bacterium]HPL30475.1 hypothetical protein [Anaerolineae bacterium]
MEGKHPLLSKTLWFNVLALVLVVARHYGYAEFVPSSLVGPLGVVAVAAVDIVLRLITRRPISLRRPASPPAEPPTA